MAVSVIPKNLQADVEELKANQVLKQYYKVTRNSSGTVVFSTQANRYTGILLITQNNGSCSIYAVGCKKETTSLCSAIAGTSNVSVDKASGNITVSMDAWSVAILITNETFT